MMRVTRMASVLAGTTVLGCTLLGTTAYGQCTVSSNPDFTQNDGGCPVTGQTDPNGGCNVVPNAFQATGTITGNNSFKINGTCGADSVSNSRDIDWYSFTVTQPCFVNLSVVMPNPTAGATPNAVLFFGQPSNCGGIFGYLYTTCPGNFPEQYISTPGTYAVVVTTSFATSGGVPCNTPYTVTVSSRTSQFSTCGTGATNCGVANPGIGGCQDVACCDKVCTVDPLCCDIEWSASCATQAQLPTASGGCGIFVYNCPASAGAPANNCATAPQTVAFNAVTPFDNTNATTDGPNNGACGSDTAKDVWFAVQATASGNMTCFVTSPTQDVVLSAYNYGTAGAPFDPTQLPSKFAGCVDVAGIGGENGTVVGVVAGNWYLWRIGIWGNPGTANPGVAGAGTVEFRLEQVAYDSGRHAPVCDNTGAAVNLGLSSGAISAGSPQRWLSAPFTVTDPSGTPDSWRTTFFVPEGFYPGGTLNEKLNWILWRRTGNNAPNYNTDQLASGQITAPTTLGTNGEAYIPVDIALPPGQYAFTVFASAVGNPCRANDGQAVFSNFAWFIGAPAGTFLQDATGIFQWRSAVQPGSGPATEVKIAGTQNACAGNTTAAGFTRYTALTGTYNNCTAGGSLGVVYSPALQILGVPTLSNNCPADINGDRTVGAADLAALLSGWGTSSPDLNGDGTVGAADLSVLLSAWGACP